MRKTFEPGTQDDVAIAADDVVLSGNLSIPQAPRGLVLFAHGSGSSRLSWRNRWVARELNEAGFATLLFDLLTADEERIDGETREFRFDIPLLAHRLSRATKWVLRQRGIADLPIGYFGSSTGAAAALAASVDWPQVEAVVSRGGRPDLAGPFLDRVRAATLLVVGGDDYAVIGMNREALAELRCEAGISIVPGAMHLFEEPGALEQVATLAAGWFDTHLGRQPAAGRGGQDEHLADSRAVGGARRKAARPLRDAARGGPAGSAQV
ncbi:MAG: alpha/beta hydrolase [Steroidobacteraceae bacterium]|jgi:dienelactone hydrolase|nr:alpha/beta hydrolase [Steroidobacteraceae bacterium]